MNRTYSEMSRIHDFEDRFNYLSLRGMVGNTTFGSDRWLNQEFYRSREWRDLRHFVIARDEGCDLGVRGFEIYDAPTIHHMNPISADDIVHSNPDILDPEFLITVSLRTHNAIHYGDQSNLPQVPVERRPGDTKLWGKR